MGAEFGQADEVVLLDGVVGDVEGLEAGDEGEVVELLPASLEDLRVCL